MIIDALKVSKQKGFGRLSHQIVQSPKMTQPPLNTVVGDVTHNKKGVFYGGICYIIYWRYSYE